jgi:hypothetical protein
LKLTKVARARDRIAVLRGGRLEMYENSGVGTLGAVAVGAGTGAGTLPLTGMSSLLFSLAAITLIAVGFVMVSVGMRVRRRRLRPSRG